MTQTNGRAAIRDRRDARLPYDEWVESIGVPIHRGYFIEDARNIEVGPWEERECNAAFIQLAGMQGTAEARITEIPPGGTTAPMKFALDEAVYVLGWTGTHDGVGRGRAEEDLRVGPSQPVPAPSWHVSAVQQRAGGPSREACPQQPPSGGHVDQCGPRLLLQQQV